MTEQEKTGKHEIARAAFDPAAWRRFVESNMKPVSSGEPPPAMRRRMVWTTILPSMCRPGTFDAPIEIGMMELDSATERRVQLSVAASAPKAGEGPEERDASLVGSSFAIALAKAAIVEVNGTQVLPHEVDLLWEAIGMAGRQRCGEDFIAHGCGFDQASMEKSRALVRVG